MSQPMSKIHTARGRRLMSVLGIEELYLPGVTEVRPTGGSCGGIVRGIYLADDLAGEVIGGLLAAANHAGLMFLPGRSRLLPERQAVVTSGSAARSSATAASTGWRR